uniref:ABC transporter domain-containing protein n=1 Tax=Kalanchoe fedtschenkoi TaxID=63787 RepID=A0A7N0SVM9_KALFE
MEGQPPPSPLPISPNACPPNNKTFTVTASSICYTKGESSTSLRLIKSACTSSSTTFILKNISFTAHPSQILALVGPSGAGKSTLLDILATRTAPTAGSLFLNNAPLNPSSFRKLSAYVPQHDYSLPMLTVHETFVFTAQLIKGSSYKSDDIASRVISLLSELGLTHLTHTKLGKGLSGGERRRISIGLSLLHDPGVLILDEPTSGLDSCSAFKVMHTLKSTAESRGCTVVLSIHQPSFKILSIIDGILLLSKGRVVHQGTLSSLEDFLVSKDYAVPLQLNSLEYAMELLNQIQQHDDVAGEEAMINKLIATTSPSSSSSSASPDELYKTKKQQRERFGRPSYRSSRMHEVFILCKRFWKMVFRTKQLLLTNTLEALVVGLVLGTIYIDIGYDKEGIEKRFGLFAFTLTFLLSSTTETLPIFINERPILIREASSGLYHLSSYLLANTLVFMPYLLAVALIYSVSVYFLVGLCGSWQAFAYFVLVIWVIVLMANSFVLFLSALAPNYIAGTSLVTILLAGFFLFSGYFISKDSLPKFWLFMHYLSMYKYALDAMLINEYSCLVTRCLIWYDGDGDNNSGSRSRSCMMTGKDVMVKKGLHENVRWTNVYILLAFFVLYRSLCLLVLMRRVSRSKR